jgi:hypothetical protein
MLSKRLSSFLTSFLILGLFSIAKPATRKPGAA